jgi:hypothetical protein
MTKWQQIDLWLKTTDGFTDNYSFCDREQKIILNEDQSLASTPAIIDGVNNEEIMIIILSYETNKQPIRILKSCPVAELLREQPYLQQLNVQIPSNDCILVRKNEADDKILTAEDLEQPIGSYLSVDNEEIHFQIAILIQIIQYDNNRLIPRPISNRNITIEQLIQSIPNRDEIYQYLASSNSHMILSNNEQLLNLDETKFYLVKDNEICSIIIDQSTDNEEEMIHQRYIICATIDDLYKQNQDIMTDQNLLFDDTIVLSRNTPLTCFQQIKSPIRFKLNNKNFQASVTITNDEQEDFSLQFRCSPSIEIRYLSQLACQLFNVNRRFYLLVELDGTELDDSMSLYELTGSTDDVQLKLISTADVKCLVMHEERSTLIPANKTTLVSTIVEEAFEKLFIPKEHMDMYEFHVLDDQENQEEVDSSFSIVDILKSFSVESTIISIKLVKK